MAFYYDDDIDELDDDEFDDEYEDEYDEFEDDEDDGFFDEFDDQDEGFEDDGEGDGFGEDIENGYGKDEDQDEEKKDEKKAKKKDQDGKDKEGKKDGKDDDKKEGKLKEFIKLAKQDIREFQISRIAKKNARRLGFPAKVMNFSCPTCKQTTLFADKRGATFRRQLTSSIIGVPHNDAIRRFVCLNPNCKDYYPAYGVTFSKQGGPGHLVRHKNIFHIAR